MAKKKPQRISTSISLAPLSVDEALHALLNTPPPTADEKPPKRATMKKAGAKKR